MVSHIVKAEIEQFFLKMKETNPLFENARNGKLTAAHVNTYLHNLHFLLYQTMPCLTLARRRAAEDGNARLEKFFLDKMGEEEGHDEWAKADMSNVRERFGIASSDPDYSRYVLNLIGYLKSTISREPSLYIVYMMLVEYFTVLAGPEWIEDLEKKCGIPRTMVSAVSNHVELDRDHVVEDMQLLDEVFHQSGELEKVRVVLHDCMELLEGLSCDLGKAE